MRTDSEIKALAEEFYEEKLNEWLDPDTDNNVKNFWVDAMIDFHNSLPKAGTERVECYLPVSVVKEPPPTMQDVFCLDVNGEEYLHQKRYTKEGEWFDASFNIYQSKEEVPTWLKKTTLTVVNPSNKQS